jgi:hypothetical protein
MMRTIWRTLVAVIQAAVLGVVVSEPTKEAVVNIREPVRCECAEC